MKRRLLSGLFLILFLLIYLAGCTGNSSNGKTTESNSSGTTAQNLEELLPKVDYEGYEFRIGNMNATTNFWFTHPSLIAEDLTSDTINDAVYYRNKQVEQDYNIKIKEDLGLVAQDIMPIMQAGDDVYDILICRIPLAYNSLASLGYLLEYRSETDINLDFPWWDKNAAETLEIDGRLYFTISALDLTHYDDTFVTYFNKAMIDDHPTLENPYELVRNNEWTIDKMYEMGIAVAADLDGNGIRDGKDRFGLISNDFALPYLCLASGAKMVDKNENGDLVMTMGQERFVNAFIKVFDAVYKDTNFFYFVTKSDQEAIQSKMFKANQSLFWVEVVSYSTIYLNEMEADYGILPAPKINAEQERFYSFCHSPFSICIPAYVSDVSRTSLIIEALSMQSLVKVVPEYYDKMLKGRGVRDPESIEMLDLLFENVVYDNAVFYVNTLLFAPFLELGAKRIDAITSFVDRLEDAVNKSLENIKYLM